jgi:AcrR family transcriptional regulator
MTGSKTLEGSNESRRRLISAGWDLVDDIGLSEALDTISVSDVAERAERSERTFWNHFDTWNSYVEALVSNIPRRGPMESGDDHGAVQVVDEALTGVSRRAMPDLVRAAAKSNWKEVTRSEELKAFRRQLLLTSRVDADHRLTEVLGRDYYGVYLPRLQRIYEDTCAQARVRPIEPFRFAELTRILAALSEGLLLQHIANPESFPDDFVADATVAVALGLLTSDERPRSVDDVEARSGVLAGPIESQHEMTRWAVSCRELVDGRETPPQWSEVAQATGVPQVELRSALQRMSVLGSLVFGQFAVGNKPDDTNENSLSIHKTTRGRGTTTEGSGRSELVAANWLCTLVRVARRNPWSAACLLQERLLPGSDIATIQDLVPLGSDLAATLGEQVQSVHDRMINAVLAAGLSDDSASPAEIAQCAMQLHPALRADRREPAP